LGNIDFLQRISIERYFAELINQWTVLRLHLFVPPCFVLIGGLTDGFKHCFGIVFPKIWKHSVYLSQHVEIFVVSPFVRSTFAVLSFCESVENFFSGHVRVEFGEFRQFEHS